MKIHKIITTLIICIFYIGTNAQISTNEIPYSFEMDNLYLLKQKSTSIKSYNIQLPKTLDQLEQEDLETDQDCIPPRFGYPISVKLDMTNSGTWTVLDNGDKLWQMEIHSPGALSINLLYDKFWIPEGSSLFLYSGDKEQHIGAFNSVNNKGDSIDFKGFSTGLIYGEKTVLEYYQPSEISQSATISIEYVVHGYRYIDIPNIQDRSFEDSGNCQVNINCPEGNNWQSEKKAVALILVNGNRYCTGSLINTTEDDGRPLLLTADHCLGGWANNDTKYDAVTRPDLNHYSFYWNYESLSCSRGGAEPLIKSTSGATVVANNSYSDFALLQLTEDPKFLSDYQPYYLGWDKTSTPGNGGVGIHHPAGDAKKIATHNMVPVSDGAFWRINWMQTSNGFSVTEGGSSGSSLLTANGHKIIGQLWGGPNLNCNDPAEDYALYGKFHISWTGNNNVDSRRRLSDWLDPHNYGLQSINALSINLNEINVNGLILQPECTPLAYPGIKFYRWGGAYGVCRNKEVIIRFKSNKTNLTCSLLDGVGSYYMRNFSGGDYEITCTPQSPIYELCITDGLRNEYIALETQSDLYVFSYDNSSDLINIRMNN